MIIRFCLMTCMLTLSSLSFAQYSTPDISMLDDLQHENLLAVPPKSPFLSASQATSPQIKQPVSQKAKRKKGVKPTRKMPQSSLNRGNTQLASQKMKNAVLKAELNAAQAELQHLRQSDCTSRPAEKSDDKISESEQLSRYIASGIHTPYNLLSAEF